MTPLRHLVLVPIVGVLGLAGPAHDREPPPIERIAFTGVDRVDANAACEGCHEAQAAEWRASLHRVAFTDDAFQRALAREPLPFCRGCHAPEADPAAPPPVRAAEIGVGCVTCHLRDGDVLASPRADGDDSELPHAVVRTAALADERACASCHEFAFPSSRRRPTGALMQSTLREHAASAHAEASCADCHMATAADGHLDHGFAITRRPDRLRAALQVEAERPGAEIVRLQLVPIDVGHAFPTGDLNRRLVIAARAIDAQGAVRVQTRRELARHHPPATVGATHFVAPAPSTADDRLVGPTAIELTLAGARADDRIEWSVVYERVDHLERRDPAASTLFAAVELAAGAL